MIALVSVSSSIIPVSYASNENNALNTEVHASQTRNNPYIQQYNKENGITSKSLNSSLSEDDETVYKTLTIYYQEDVKVGKILAQVAKDTDVQIKATSLKKEDKIDVMHKIKEIYSSVKESSDQKVLVDFIERYAKDSKDIASIQFLDAVRPQPSKTLIPQPEEDKKKGVSTSTAQNPAATLNSSFNATTAAEWAYNNYNRYSTDFPTFTKWGSDCTNFVSQALYKGGLAMTGNWYIYKKNNTYLVPESADQLNYSWSLSDPSPWTSVKEFYSYWRGKYVLIEVSIEAIW
ncbi:amidase domain-containing protein [Paenibacillus oleatilyticus]|uniref:Amidase domain-containing protein n=1 Tax=Paenibacillus oleatilyticus TaxID=2594886 RepID=A0ABV4V729_9BACL